MTVLQFQENNSLFFMIWALSVPVGSILACVGLLIYARSKGSRIWLFGIGLTLLLILIGFLPIPGYYPPIFGIGGGLILTLFLITIWFWAKRRTNSGCPNNHILDIRLAVHISKPV